MAKPKREQLTQDRQIRALKAEEDAFEHAIKDTRGLRIKVAPSGRKSWYYRYRHRKTGRLQRVKLGEYRPGGMTLADARDEVDRQRQIVNTYGSAKSSGMPIGKPSGPN